MFTLIFNQLLKMLFIMLLAYFCYKIGLITQEGNRTLSNLLLQLRLQPISSGSSWHIF